MTLPELLCTKAKKSQHQDLGRAHAQNDISQIWLWCHTVSCHNNNGGKKCVQRDGKLYPDQSYMYQVLFNRRGKWLEKFPMDRGNNAEWICIWWWLNLVIVFTTKLLLRSLLRISPLDDLEDLEDLSSWGSWETFLLRIFPLDNFDDLKDLSFWGFIFRASSVETKQLSWREKGRNSITRGKEIV